MQLINSVSLTLTIQKNISVIFHTLSRYLCHHFLKTVIEKRTNSGNFDVNVNLLKTLVELGMDAYDFSIRLSFISVVLTP